MSRVLVVICSPSFRSIEARCQRAVPSQSSLSLERVVKDQWSRHQNLCKSRDPATFGTLASSALLSGKRNLEDRLTVAKATAHPDRRLISSEDVEGTNVYGVRDEAIGEIDHLLIDKVSGRVVYAVMSFGGFLGLAHSHRVCGDELWRFASTRSQSLSHSLVSPEIRYQSRRLQNWHHGTAGA
jgi:hypothetical protein